MAEFSIFRMIVYASVLLVIIYLAVSFFILPKEKPSGIIGKMLQTAEGNEGKYLDKEIYFSKEDLIYAKAFENYSRSISIKCISPEFCTPDIVVFDERSASFRKGITMKVSARCVYEVNLYKCALYLGKKPAQLEISKFRISDLNESIVFDVANNGGVEAENIKNRVLIYKRIMANNQNKEFLYKDLEPRIIPVLKQGEEISSSFEFGSLESGSYAVKFSSWAEEAGFDSKSADFSVSIESVGNCATGKQEETVIIGGKCIEKYSCSNCNNASKCVDAWAARMPDKTFSIEDKDYASIVHNANSNGECGTEAAQANPPAQPQNANAEEFAYNQQPTLNAQQVDSILASYNSPASGQGAVFVPLGQRYNLDVAFMLAQYLQESTMGTASGYGQTKAIGNIISTGRCPQFCDYARPNGFCGYNSWGNSAEHFYCYINERYINNAAEGNPNTPEEIIPIYAPSSENNTQSYISLIERCVRKWRGGSYGRC